MKTISNIPTGVVPKVAGITYILIILIGVLKVNFIEPGIIAAGDHNTVNSILAKESLFRIGIACELIMYVLVVVLSLALYIILKPINKNLALSALYFRFGEAVIGCVITILSGMMPLLLLHDEAAVEKAQLQGLAEAFLSLRIAGLNVVLIFVGLGGTVFCYLFYRSWLVTRMLAAWGMFTYVSMFVLGFLNILVPERPDIMETVLFGLGAVFEIVFGFWLLLKGVDYKKWNGIAG